jgi:hypothetical protein
MGKFRIKITAWWASNEYVQFKYSTNGIIWRKIYKCEYEILDEWYYMQPLTTHYSNSESTIAKFKTIDDIRKYEQEEKQKLIKYNADIDARNKRKEAERKAVYKRFT